MGCGGARLATEGTVSEIAPQLSRILAIAVQQVEGDEARLAPAKQEIVEQGLPVTVQTHDLAIEDD